MGEQRDEFNLDSADFAARDTDPLEQRWDESVRQAIRRLTPAKASVVAAILLDYTSRRGYMLSETYFPWLEMIATDADGASVKLWLRGHVSNPTQRVLVAYARTHYVYLIEWDTFIEHWDDFCYPSSDDVVVCPLTEEWVLYFSHEEVLFWSKPKRKATGRPLAHNRS